jgi:WD40 repeat protein
MNAHDGEYIASMQFSNDNFKLFTITETGLFSVWDLSTLKRIFFNHFLRDTVNMIVCKATEKIYIAFKDEVIVLKNVVGYPAYDNLR